MFVCACACVCVCVCVHLCYASSDKHLVYVLTKGVLVLVCFFGGGFVR